MPPIENHRRDNAAATTTTGTHRLVPPAFHVVTNTARGSVARYSSHLNRFRSDVKEGSLSIWSRMEGKNFASLLLYELGENPLPAAMAKARWERKRREDISAFASVQGIPRDSKGPVEPYHPAGKPLRNQTGSKHHLQFGHFGTGGVTLGGPDMDEVG